MAVSQPDIDRLIDAYLSVSTYNFKDYSIKSFMRRIEKLMMDNKLDVEGLINKITTDAIFVEQSVKDITVNTTELFRDPKIWHAIRYRILEKLKDQRRINIWHAGSSTGQEVYSMMILLNEMGLLDKTNIFASDINTDVIDTAKKGEYIYRFNLDYLDNFNQVVRQNPYNFDEFKEVPYSKYFEIDKAKDIIKLNSFLRKKPVYFKHDLVNDGNIFNTKFDLILCRNVLIYFNYELQNNVFDLFHESLFRKGTLVLGVHESILGTKALKFNKKGLYYTKK